MRRYTDLLPRLVVSRLREKPLLALLAIVAVAVSIGLWVWHVQTTVYQLRVGSGVELKYRKELLSILCDEALQYDLRFQVQQPFTRAADSIAMVGSGELDLAVVPAGLAVRAEHVTQVAVLDCEPLQLFVRPDMLAGGVAALQGRRINLGSPGSGTRSIARDVLDFIGMQPESDYEEESYSYPELIALSPEAMPDGVFSLAPLPSPLGERLVQQYGYRLLELPFGAAMNLRKSAIEDVVVPAHTYGAQPAVPDRPLHTVGSRAVVIANSAVPKTAIRRLLEVLYESDFARRAGLPPLNASLILRSAEYPNHSGTTAYLHRHDPWINKDFIDNVMNLRGLGVSVTSAVILLWQWLRRRRTSGMNDYLRLCTKLEIDAVQTSRQAGLPPEQLASYQQQLAELRAEALEKHLCGALPSDQQFGLLLSRLDNLEQLLPALAAKQRWSMPTAEIERRAA